MFKRTWSRVLLIAGLLLGSSVAVPSAFTASPITSVGTFDDQSVYVGYNLGPVWSHVGGLPDFYKGTTSYSNSPGAQVSFTYNGNHIVDYCSDMGPLKGNIRVSIDNQQIREYNFNAPSRILNVCLRFDSIPSATSHTVVIENIDTGGRYLAIDYINVI